MGVGLSRIGRAPSIGGVVERRGGGIVPPLPFRNVGTRGQLHTQLWPTNGTKTRFKGRLHYRVGPAAVTSLKLVFANWYIQAVNSSATESNGPNAVTVTRLALEYNGVTVPVTVGGSRSFAVPAGGDVETDAVAASAFGVASVPSGAIVYCRIVHDLVSGEQHPSYPMFGEDKGYRYDPAAGSNATADEVDGSGVMTAPTGADGSNQPPFAPIMLAGQYGSAGTRSMVFFGDSIATSSNDANTQGLNGGCWIRRACWTAGVPYFGMTIGSNLAAYWALAKAKRMALLAKGYWTDALVELGINDTSGGSTATAALRTIYTDVRSAGIARVFQSTILPKTTSTTKWTDLAGQTPVSGFAPSAERDTANAAILADVGVTGRIDGMVDVAAAVQDASQTSKHKLRPFTTTLASAYTAGTATIVLTDAPTLREYLAVSSGGTFDASTRRVTAVTGSGPFTATLEAGFASSHAQGDPVRALPTPDGTHPGDLVQADMAGAAASYAASLAA